MRDLEGLRAEISQHMSTDPKKFVEEMVRATTEWNLVLRALGAPPQVQVQEQAAIMEEFVSLFKAKVEEELLASQKQTNDALAAALGMRSAK